MKNNNKEEKWKPSKIKTKKSPHSSKKNNKKHRRQIRKINKQTHNNLKINPKMMNGKAYLQDKDF